MLTNEKICTLIGGPELGEWEWVAAGLYVVALLRAYVWYVLLREKIEVLLLGLVVLLVCAHRIPPFRLVEPSQRGCVVLDLDDPGLDVSSVFLGSVSSALEPEVSFANSHFRLATRFNVDFPNTVLVRDRLIDPHAPDVLCTPFACAHHTSCTLSRGDVPKSESSYKWCSRPQSSPPLPDEELLPANGRTPSIFCPPSAMASTQRLVSLVLLRFDGADAHQLCDLRRPRASLQASDHCCTIRSSPTTPRVDRRASLRGVRVSRPS